MKRLLRLWRILKGITVSFLKIFKKITDVSPKFLAEFSQACAISGEIFSKPSDSQFIAIVEFFQS